MEEKIENIDNQVKELESKIEKQLYNVCLTNSNYSKKSKESF